MSDWKVKQHDSLNAAVKAMADGGHLFAIDLDSFEKILEIEYYTYNDLLNLSFGHNLVFIELEMKEGFEF